MGLGSGSKAALFLSSSSQAVTLLPLFTHSPTDSLSRKWDLYWGEETREIERRCFLRGE